MSKSSSRQSAGALPTLPPGPSAGDGCSSLHVHARWNSVSASAADLLPSEGGLLRNSKNSAVSHEILRNH